MEKYNLTQTGQEVQDILDNATPQSDLAEEVERAQEAERLLGEGIQQNADDIDALEEKVPSGASAENKLATEEYVNESVETAIDAEKDRAQEAESTLHDDIDAEEDRAQEAESTLQNYIEEEEERAKAAERQNADDIDALEAVVPVDATSENKLATIDDVTNEANARETADNSLSSAIEAILLLIPSAATSLNKLADKDFVNSSISAASATFRGTYNLVSDLRLTVSATRAQIALALNSSVAVKDNNDYVFVQIPTADATPTQIAKTERFKYNGTIWEYEYDLNNSGYTSAQWAAINSGITEALVNKLSDLPMNADLTTALGVLTRSITTINLKIPETASQANKLVDTAAMESYIVQVLDVLTASFNVTSSDGHVTVQISQVDGKITSLALTTLDIASAASLSLVEGRVTTAEGNISTNSADIAILQDAYAALTQSALVIVKPTDTWPVASPATSTIYRVVDRTHTPPQYYSDYMWNGTAMVLMAQYDNTIDPRPKKASLNLVTSGGVFDNMGALDVSELNATENPHTLAQYVDLSAALAAIPTDYRKGGMSIKFVQSSDHNYVQYLYKKTDAATAATFANVANWEKMNLEEEVSQLGREVDDLDEAVNGGNEETIVAATYNYGFINSSNGVIGGRSNQTTYQYTDAIELTDDVNSIKCYGLPITANMAAVGFYTISALPISSGQASRTIGVIENTQSGADNTILEISAEKIAEMKVAGAHYFSVCVLAAGTKGISYFTITKGLADDIDGLKSDVNALNTSVSAMSESIKKIDGGSSTTHYGDDVFSEVGFLGNDGGINTNNAWNHTPAISLVSVIGIHALCELGNPYGGGVNFYNSSTISKGTFVSNIGSNTGTNNGEITITQVQIEAAVANGATHFAVTKNNNYISELDITHTIKSMDERFSEQDAKISYIESIAVPRIIISTNDSEIEIYGKLKSARDTGNCDVIWEFGTYNFTDTLYTYMKTLREHIVVGAYELPLGGGCRYFFNNSVLNFSITTFDGSCNAFGCVRKNCGDYSLHDGIINATNMSYCIHDEGQGEDGTYVHEYHNMIFNYLTDGVALGKCIGGGTGKDGCAILDKCIFISTDNTDCDCDVSWHGLNNSEAASKFKIVATNNYFSKKISLDNMSVNQYGTLLYCGNSHAVAPNNRKRWTKYEAGNTTRE